jgi:hypothetical protein
MVRFVAFENPIGIGVACVSQKVRSVAGRTSVGVLISPVPPTSLKLSESLIARLAYL